MRMTKPFSVSAELDRVVEWRRQAYASSLFNVNSAAGVIANTMNFLMRKHRLGARLRNYAAVFRRLRDESDSTGDGRGSLRARLQIKSARP